MAHYSCRRPQVVAGDNLGALTGQLGCRESAKGVDAGHRNVIQFQKGLSVPEFLQLYGTEAQCEEALAQIRWADGFQCPRCNGSLYGLVYGRSSVPWSGVTQEEQPRRSRG